MTDEQDAEHKRLMEQRNIVRAQILEDLSGLPKGRKYRRVSDKLRRFVKDYMPEVEIVRTGGGEIVRLKREL